MSASPATGSLEALESLAPFGAGLLLLGAGGWSTASALGVADLAPGPLGAVPLPAALLVTGAGAGILLAAWQLLCLRRAAAGAREDAARAAAERDRAMLQTRRMRAQAEGLALMREIHRSAAIPERHDRLHRILTLVGDLCEAREVDLFAAVAGGPLPVLPAACLRPGRAEEVFVAFDPEVYARMLETAASAVASAPEVLEATLSSVSCWAVLEGRAMVGTRALARIRVRRTISGPEDPQLRQNTAAVLEAWLARLDYGPAACQQAAGALQQRRALRHLDRAAAPGHAPGEDALVFDVPLIAGQRPVGVLRVRRAVEDGEGLAAETLEELLLESAKHVALAIKKDEDDRQAITDQLTGLFIKRQFLEVLERLRGEAAGEGKGFALILCDLDHFKQVNDVHGHLTGDLILNGVARVLRSGLRAGDLAFRYGGEELAILLPGAAQPAALRIAERLRAAVQRSVLMGETAQVVPVTISAGVAVHQPGLTAAQLISRADRALYASKHAGRNRVTAWRPELPGPAVPSPAPAAATVCAALAARDAAQPLTSTLATR